MARIQGVTIQIHVLEQTGTDAFNRPTYSETLVDVDNVLIGEPSSQEIVDTLNLTGKKLVYTLGIPKGDTHDWTDTKVSFWGMTFRTIGEPTQGIEAMIPLQWNKKVRVERYGKD